MNGLKNVSGGFRLSSNINDVTERMWQEVNSTDKNYIGKKTKIF